MLSSLSASLPIPFTLSLVWYGLVGDLSFGQVITAGGFSRVPVSHLKSYGQLYSMYVSMVLLTCSLCTYVHTSYSCVCY